MQRRVDGSGSVSFTFADDEPAPAEKRSTRPSLLDAPPHDGPQAYDADIARYAQNAAAPARTASDATTARPRANDEVLFLGTNTQKTADGKTTQSDLEFHNLQFASGNKATRIEASKDSSIAVRGQKFDLSRPVDVDAWSRTLGLPAAQASAVARVIQGADLSGRDELAQLATVWARGELGGSVPSRLVLSGHLADRIMDADGSNGVLAKDLQALAKAMPRAASQVEDLMVSACYGGSQAQLDAWRGAFPNARSIWAYGDGGHTLRDKSPTGAVSVEHIVEWEKETRGRSLPNAKPQTNLDAMGRATLQNVTLWNGAYHVRS